MTIFAITIVIIISIIFMYNSLIYKSNQVDNIFSTVDVLLQKRYDLIPNLVSVVKAYAKHESEIFTTISELRSKAISPGITNDEKVCVSDEVNNCIDRILIITESYPELKSNNQFLKLQESLCEIEEQISAARRAYNAMVTDYNNAIESIPTNLIARSMKYSKKALFKKDI